MRIIYSMRKYLRQCNRRGSSCHLEISQKKVSLKHKANFHYILSPDLHALHLLTNKCACASVFCGNDVFHCPDTPFVFNFRRKEDWSMPWLRVRRLPMRLRYFQQFVSGEVWSPFIRCTFLQRVYLIALLSWINHKSTFWVPIPCISLSTYMTQSVVKTWYVL